MLFHEIVKMYVLFSMAQMAFGAHLETNLNSRSSVCQANQFCMSDRSGSPPVGRRPCCDSCACKIDCYIGQRCCLDTDDVQITDSRLVCKSMDEHFNRKRNISHIFGRPTQMYYAIEGCPSSFQDEDVKVGCMEPMRVRDHVFVTDQDSMIIYKNYHCAICNGAKNYVFWNLRLECFYAETFYSASNHEESILEECSFNSVPVTSGSVDHTWTCDPWRIDRCNDTGDFTSYNDVISDTCTMHAGQNATATYEQLRSAFCSMCSMRSDLTSDHPKCSDPTDVGKDIFGIPFEGILELESYDPIENHQKQDSQDGRCPPNEIPDPLTAKCVEFVCPFGHVPVYGSCINFIKSTNFSVTGIYEFEVTSPDNISWARETKGRLYESIEKTVKYHFARRNCVLCRMYVYTDTFLVKAITGETCPNEILLEIFKDVSLITRVPGVELDEKIRVKIKISSRYSNIDDPYRLNIYSIRAQRETFYRRCAEAYLISPKFYCQRIRFSLLKLTNDGLTNATIGRILEKSVPDMYVNGNIATYAICVGDYMNIANIGVWNYAFKMYLLILPLWALLLNSY